MAMESVELIYSYFPDLTDRQKVQFPGYEHYTGIGMPKLMLSPEKIWMPSGYIMCYIP